ncbi:hypothetical protein T484DRAFT_2509128 [Baffinella frigidus]|nr:hypothetical protein T484DRAFT_2509128 [Cryptophyta sp. CCMP2293]
MEQALKKFYGRKREQRQADMKEFSAKWIVPSLSLGSLPSQETSNLSLDDARGSKTQRLPKIWGAHPMPGRAMTERNSVGRGPRHQFRRNDGTKGGSMSDAGGGVHPENSQLTFNSSIHHASMTSTNATSRPQADSRYYTAKVAPMHVDFVRMEDEADVVTAVAFSLDGITQQSKFHRQSDAEHATSAEAFTFQPADPNTT